MKKQLKEKNKSKKSKNVQRIKKNKTVLSLLVLSIVMSLGITASVLASTIPSESVTETIVTQDTDNVIITETTSSNTNVQIEESEETQETVEENQTKSAEVQNLELEDSDEVINEDQDYLEDDSLIKATTLTTFASTGIYIVNGPDFVNEAFDTLVGACNAINQASGVAYTITVTANDNLEETIGVIDTGKEVTLTSGDGGPFVITQNDSSGGSTRHIAVKGKLILQNIVLDGSGNSGGISVIDGELLLDGATIQNGYRKGTGAGVSVNNASFTMRSGVIDNNHCDFGYGNSGGGVFLGKNATFTMQGGSIKNNSATWGGGVEVGEDSIFLMEGGEITNNQTELNTNGHGGGVHVYAKGEFHLKGGTISKNGAQVGAGVFVGQGTSVERKTPGKFFIEGGSITDNTGQMGAGVGCQWRGHITMSGGSISNNTATGGGGGGGVLVAYPDAEGLVSFVMTGGEISDNKAEAYDGGGISIMNTAGTNVDVIIGEKGRDIPVIKNNTSAKSGGGIFAYANPIIINEGKISNNTAASFGGGISLFANSSLAINGGVIGGLSGEGNTADRGGGIGTNASANVITGKDVQIIGNEATSATDGGGGVLINENSTASFENSIIQDNKASSGHGGGIYVTENGKLAITGKTHIAGNYAAQEGGGIYTANVGDYDNLLDTDYQNITTGAQTVFENNTAEEAYLPPEIADSYDNIDFAKTSIMQNDAYIHPINNYDINYRGEPLPESFTIIYQDGVEDEIIFEDQVYKNILKGKPTPSFVGTPERKGYKFVGWKPEVAATVTEDAIYIAQWEKVVDPVDPTTKPTETVTIKPSQSETTELVTPKTGENSNLMLPIILSGSAILLALSVIIIKKKNKNQA